MADPAGVAAGGVVQAHAAPASARVKASASDGAWAGQAVRDVEEGMSYDWL
ncbi:hypothetical protein GCM10009069_19910 [Algimonas arctica]|uniref:Uncharacterized protein n=1 Tax=Algimonas arctica TaxID=1479486 RepID=A0A8J3G2Q6_9PROT|nr:hypothetical protein GCM10009069_19910 [Algimonas arctica]